MPRLLLAFFLPLITTAGYAASLCESGLRQSPININPKTISGEKQSAMQVDYRTVTLKLANDGRTAWVRQNGAGLLRLGRESFALQQFHFHTPGGDQINNEPFPFAAHLVHKSASGQWLTLEVPFRLGADNALLARLLPLIPRQAGAVVKHPKVQVSALELLPKNLAYYRYSGSLTEKPCTENVEWLVLKQPLELSATQFKQWQQLFKDNMRAINPGNGRVVLESL